MQVGSVSLASNATPRKYELALVINPELSAEEVEKLLTWARKMITSWGGEVDRTLEEGKKALAYEIEGHNEAYYVYVKFTLASDKVNDLDMKVKYEEKVIRHLVVREDE